MMKKCNGILIIIGLVCLVLPLTGCGRATEIRQAMKEYLMNSIKEIEMMNTKYLNEQRASLAEMKNAKVDDEEMLRERENELTVLEKERTEYWPPSLGPRPPSVGPLLDANYCFAAMLKDLHNTLISLGSLGVEPQYSRFWGALTPEGAAIFMPSWLADLATRIGADPAKSGWKSLMPYTHTGLVCEAMCSETLSRNKFLGDCFAYWERHTEVIREISILESNIKELQQRISMKEGYIDNLTKNIAQCAGEYENLRNIWNTNYQGWKVRKGQENTYVVSGHGLGYCATGWCTGEWYYYDEEAFQPADSQSRALLTKMETCKARQD